MQLPGNLRSTTLGDLLGALHRSGCSGTLELVEDQGAAAGRQHRVHLAQGLVERVETELPVARLGEILMHEGFVTRALIERMAVETRRTPSRPLGQLLVRECAITRDVLSAALRYQLRRRLDTLFALKSACVRFRVPRPDPSGKGEIPLSPREFLHGRARHQRRLPNPPPRSAPRVDRERQKALETLGVAATATPQAIRHAFRIQALKVHPDRHPSASPPERQWLLQRFAELSAAYHLLVG
jgi:DnaJ-domain-containing protein 1